MAKINDSGKKYIETDLIKRLDVIIRLIIEANTEKENFTNSNIIPMLKTIGLDPIEIARIYGKKKSSDIAPYLYKKNSKKN